MIKKYISKYDISINVKGVHVSFSALTGGGSVYYTEDEQLQKNMESHPKFGKLFTMEEVPVVVKPEKTEKEESKSNGKKQIVVACLDDAKEYLCDSLGISRTKLRSEKAIKDAAAQNGIEFVGI